MRCRAGRPTYYGHSVGAAVGLGWVEHPDGEHIDSAFLEQDGFTVEVAGEAVGAQLSLRPFHDPKRERVKM